MPGFFAFTIHFVSLLFSLLCIMLVAFDKFYY